ncbi:MAG: hypothetical protein GQ560_03865 [Dehalococcoidia bacterium]|nr:hypothetical protein [Dehalococcoidia bacterium]
MTKGIIKSFLVIFATALIVSPTFAAKPQNVISMSNGYPSGAHFNLIIHGKKTGNSDVATEEITTFNCPSGEGGNSVFIADYGNSTIQYISNKKASLTGLTVLDACAEAFDTNPVKVQLPYDEYYVFARLHGTPKNKHGGQSSVILTPEPVLQVCNYNDGYTGDEPDDFATYTECNESSLWLLGMVTTSGAYYATPHTAERYDTSKKGKGPKKAEEITGLFTWTGYVCDASLDVNGDGVIDENDVTGDLDGDGDIDSNDNYGALLSSCTYYENEWVFNVADLVVQDQDIENKGGKTLQIRFYPRSTTTFEPPPTTPNQ